MRLESIHLREVGPMKHYDLDLQDQWRHRVHPMTLLSGPNGCGKSTILRAASHLWQLAGQWLALPSRLPGDRSGPALWLKRWGGAGMVLSEIAGVPGKVGVFYGHPSHFAEVKHLADHWIGETKVAREGRVLLHKGQAWLHEWSEGFKRLGLNPNELETANVIHLDGEERRWTPPRVGFGEVVADDPGRRWLVNYAPTPEWRGQVEASLIAMKTVNPERYEEVLHELNAFLKPKHILPDPDQNMRLRVSTGEEGRTHSLDDLSAGEHQILIQLFLVSRSLMPGGLVMIDEPDLHLHPSLLSLYLTRLELLVQKRNGQLLLTSHNPELWARYEARDNRVQLEGAR